MDDPHLVEQVRALHSPGVTTNAIARELGVPRGQVAPILRAIRREEKGAPPEAGLVGCWVSPGWSAGLSVDEGRRWPDRNVHDASGAGLVGVVVARERPPLRDTVSICGYLVDTFCLGIKDALGPRTVSRRRLAEFVEAFFGAFDGDPVDAPIDLAQHLVWGAVEYARGLGFEPHRDFQAAQRHLEPLTGPSAIRFGFEGKPYYMQGPHDDADRILRTLEERLGTDGFHYTVAVPLG